MITEASERYKAAYCGPACELEHTAMEYQLMRATDKIMMLESRIAKLECENRNLRTKIKEMETIERLDAKRKMDAVLERRELALANAKRVYERQNGVTPTALRRLSFSEVQGCSGRYNEIVG